MANAKVQAVVEATVGGDNCRSDIEDRLVPLSENTCFKKAVTLGPGESATLWDADTDSFTSPRVIQFVTDPDNVYEDGLSRSVTTAGSAPRLRLLLYYATAVDGTGTAIAVSWNIYREMPVQLPGYDAFTTLMGSTARYLTKIEVANAMTTGFGDITGSLTMFN